jgi:hypothetical protein
MSPKNLWNLSTSPSVDFFLTLITGNAVCDVHLGCKVIVDISRMYDHCPDTSVLLVGPFGTGKWKINDAC